MGTLQAALPKYERWNSGKPAISHLGEESCRVATTISQPIRANCSLVLKNVSRFRNDKLIRFFFNRRSWRADELFHFFFGHHLFQFFSLHRRVDSINTGTLHRYSSYLHQRASYIAHLNSACSYPFS